MRKQTGKLTALILAAAILLSVAQSAFFTVSADTTSGYYTFTVTNGCATITQVDNGINGNITIPSKLNGYTVTKIEEFAFSYCSDITGINVPGSITDIEKGAFSDCPGIASITVDKNNPVYHADRNCLIATSSKKLIAGCKNSVIPDDGSVTRIGNRAFWGCTGLKDLTIPSTVTYIDYFAFGGCTGISDIFIPASVTFLGSDAFYACSNLQSITVDEKNTFYHSANNCLIDTKAKEIIAGCRNSIIPDDGSVTKIGVEAFTGCKGLTSIVIPDCITSIYTAAFSGCKNLKSVTISNNLTTIWGFVFSECESLTSVAIPKSVTSIDVCAFAHCTGLKSLYIPKTVTSMEDNAFSGCSGLESITVEKGNPILHSDGNCLIKTNEKKLILGCNKSVIPGDGSVTSIGMNAFVYCNKLKGIVIPEGVTTISDMAFYECSAMKTIILPQSLKFVGNFAFEFCGSLRDVYYTGTKAQRSGINILTDCDDNACLLNADWHYNHNPETLICFHNDTEIRNKSATTCTSNGYTGDVYCKECGEMLEAGRLIRSSGHEYGWYITKLATPEEDGCRELICTVCGLKQGSSSEILYTGHITGDINDDTDVDNKDLIRLFQHLSEWGVQVNEAALDINADRSIDNKDLIRLFQFLSEWDVYIY